MNSRESYEKYLTFSLIYRVAIIIICCFSALTWFPFGLLPLLLIVPMVVRECRTKKYFPQWGMSPFEIPTWITILFLAVLAGFIGIDIFTNTDLTPWFTTMLMFTYLIVDSAYHLYYTKKYHLDRFDSVAELLLEYPEALPKLRRPLREGEGVKKDDE